MGFGYND
jgi:uncharacterized protein YigA (DUF484 family)